jgi:hypothetical protein
MSLGMGLRKAYKRAVLPSLDSFAKNPPNKHDPQG